MTQPRCLCAVMSVKVKEGHEKDGLTPEQVTTLLDLICDETDFAQVSSYSSLLRHRRLEQSLAASRVAFSPFYVVIREPSFIPRCQTSAHHSTRWQVAARPDRFCSSGMEPWSFVPSNTEFISVRRAPTRAL